MPEVITSTKNETIKAIARLKRTRERTRTGSILVEGPNGLEGVANAGLDPTVILVAEDDQRTLDRLPDFPSAKVHLVTQAVLKSVADTAHPRSPIVVIDRPAAGRLRSHNTIVLVDIGDPGNAGTIVRTAAALGWDVAYTPGCVDVWSPKTLRASAGAHFRTRISPVDLAAGDQPLSDLTVVAAVVEGGAASVDEPGPYALLVGNEAHGLDPQQILAASHRLTIGMVDSTESLNVATAAALAMYVLGHGHNGQTLDA